MYKKALTILFATLSLVAGPIFSQGASADTLADEATVEQMSSTNGADSTIAPEAVSLQASPEVFGATDQKPETADANAHETVEQQLDAAVSKIAALIQRDNLSAVVYPNYEESMVAVEYEFSMDFGQLVSKVLESVGDAVKVTYTAVDSIDWVEQSLQGGDGVLAGTQSCSSGFLAYKGTNFGITTAGHCSGMALYKGNTYYVIADQATAVGDLRWYQLGVMQTAKPMVRSDATPMVYVTSSSPLVVQGIQTVTPTSKGEAICFHGAVSNQICTVLYAVNYANSLYSGLLVAANGLTQAGDSGGVWYRYVSGGVEAIGIHSGISIVDGVARSVFTPVTTLGTIGVTVYTALN